MCICKHTAAPILEYHLLIILKKTYGTNATRYGGKSINVLGSDLRRAHQSYAFLWATRKGAVRDDELETINQYND